MANPGKQKQNGKGKAEKTERDEASDSSEDEFPGEEESEDSDSELGEEENIQVDLEARTPLEKDFHGIRQLLGRLFVMIHVDASELADVIIAQDDLGSTIKVADEEDEESGTSEKTDQEEQEVYGISSLINLKQHNEKQFVQQLKKSVLSKCKSSTPDQLAKFQNILDTKNVGFLINERFINIPPQFAVPLHRSLYEESKEHTAAQNLDYLLLISKTMKLTEHPEAAAAAASNTEPKGAKRAKKSETMEWTNVEEELFHVASEVSFDYSVTEATGLAIGGSWDQGSQYAKPSRTVMLVPAERWAGVVEGVEELIDGGA